MESNDSPEIADRGETSDIPGLPSGAQSKRKRKKKAEVAVLKNSLLDRHKWLSTIAYYQSIKMNVWMLNHTLSDRTKW